MNELWKKTYVYCQRTKKEQKMDSHFIHRLLNSPFPFISLHIQPPDPKITEDQIAKDYQEWTPLDEAISWGDLESAKRLWKKGRQPNLDVYRDGERTPVHSFASRTVLKWVFTEKVLPLYVLNVKDDENHTPLDNAIHDGDLETAKLLWEMGGRPNLDEVYCDGEWSPLYDTVRWGCTTILKWGFTEGVLPLHILKNKCDGRTLLDVAISYRIQETVAFLRDLQQVCTTFLAIQLAKRDHRQMCVLRRLPNELLDMVVEEVAARHNRKVVWH